MDGKTPVTLLQEYFAKRGIVPNYTLIENNVGSNKPSFTYSVSGFGKCAVSIGSSKKEAKHGAAAKLLAMLVDGGFEDIVDNPYAVTLKENTVGALQEFCLTYMTTVPRYQEVSVSGEPHSRMFVIECSIPPFKTLGEGRTKKHAKHIAAYLMLIELKKSDEINTLVLKNHSHNNDSKKHICLNKNSNEVKQCKAVERLCEKLMTEVNISSFRKTHEFKLEHHFVKIFQKEEFSKSDKWRNLKNNLKVNINDPFDYFSELMSQLSLHWKIIPIPLKEDVRGIMISLQIRQLGDATFFGMGSDENDAIRDAADAALNWLSIMGS